MGKRRKVTLMKRFSVKEKGPQKMARGQFIHESENLKVKTQQF